MIYTDANGNQTLLDPSVYSIAFTAAVTGALWGIGVQLTYPLTGSPIASGTSLRLSRIFSLQQLTSISNQGDFAPQNIEAMGDIEEMQLQQIASRTGLITGPWASSVQYNFGDVVLDGSNGANTGNYYQCVIPNLSTVWATDLAAGDWSLAIDVQIIAGYATSAAASASAALASQNATATSASSASTSATTATTQAGISTTQAAAAAVSATQASNYALSYSGTSTTSLAIATGAKVFTTQASKLWVNGQYLQIASNASALNYMHGTVTSYSGTTLTMNITDIGGSGTHADWNISISGTQGTQGPTGAGNIVASTIGQIAVYSASQGVTGSSVLTSNSNISGSSTTDNFLNLTATMPTTMAAPTNGININLTTAGSSSFSPSGINFTYNPGYTGISTVAAISMVNSVAGTGATYAAASGSAGYRPATYNVCGQFTTNATTAGVNTAVRAMASNSSVANYSGWFTSEASGNTPALNVGVASFALNATTNCAGFFALADYGTSAPTFSNAALIADNGAVATDIFVARDNGTTIFKIIDGGHAVIGGGVSASELRLLEPSGSGANYTAFKAQAQAGDVTYTLPAADGASGYVIQTNGSGTLSWNSQFCVQRVSTETGAVASGTGTFTLNDTIPVNTNGDQYMSLSITPKNSSNILVIDVFAITSNSSSGSDMFIGLFQDATSNALAAVPYLNSANTHPINTPPLRYIMAAGTTLATTFKVRIGTTSGTTTFNGISGSRIFGGVCASSITITEYAS